MSLIKFLLSQLLVILGKMYNQWQQGIMQRSESCMKASGHEQERTRSVSLSFSQWISVVKNGGEKHMLHNTKPSTDFLKYVFLIFQEVLKPIIDLL